tara:strand:- start:118 stop:957 length:840 start_codon:yes stop_codon:yes gene_type:complete
MTDNHRNVDEKVVEAFGREWSRFTNLEASEKDLASIFRAYTVNFPWESLPDNAIGFDAGCGSGRWAKFFASRVGYLHCIDASQEALEVAKIVLRDYQNIEFHHEDLSNLSLEEESCDFGYSLGVLHHIPDVEDALESCVARLKPGAPFLVYLYHDLSSASWVFRQIFMFVTVLRVGISNLPFRIRHFLTDLLAFMVYFPLARTARFIEKLGLNPSFIPLFQYRNRSLYVMRNDSLDRFGTRLEKRFSRDEVFELLISSGLENIYISDDPPWWVAVGHKS